MRLDSIVVAGSDGALAALADRLAGPPSAPALAFAFYGARRDPAAVAGALRSALPGTPFLGGSSCRGVLFPDRRPTPDDIGVVLIHDPAGDYGVGAEPLGDDPAGAAARALDKACAACGCDGALPEAVWLYQPPGFEERVLEGLRRVTGDRCPVIGGSAADDDVSGRWSQIASTPDWRPGEPVVVVAALFPGGAVAASFNCGYAPAGPEGTVTRADGRVIGEIDGWPAAEVFDRWRGVSAPGAPRSLLAESALSPLGVAAGAVQGVARHRLVHPAEARPDGGLAAFAEVAEGETVLLMEGAPEALARRAGAAVADAAALLPEPERFAGALAIFCGGCLMAVGDRLDALAAGFAEGAQGRPALAAFTFGEQGPLGDRCVHANLMVSALAFGG